jgi:hypothetical protein
LFQYPLATTPAVSETPRGVVLPKLILSAADARGPSIEDAMVKTAKRRKLRGLRRIIE